MKTLFKLSLCLLLWGCTTTGVIDTHYQEFVSHEKVLKFQVENQHFKDHMLFDEVTKDLHNIQDINDYFNSLKYHTDQYNYGVTDYWATPEEFLINGGGDCEDYAVAKYYALKKIGYTEQNLRIAIIEKTKDYPAHAVTMFRDRQDHEWYLMDNARYEILTVAKSGYKIAYGVNLTETYVYR